MNPWYAFLLGFFAAAVPHMYVLRQTQRRLTWLTRWSQVHLGMVPGSRSPTDLLAMIEAERPSGVPIEKVLADLITTAKARRTRGAP